MQVRRAHRRRRSRHRNQHREGFHHGRCARASLRFGPRYVNRKGAPCGAQGHEGGGRHQEAITDAFFQELAFGTAGLRGTLGAGTSNRMNIYTVGRATQGFADYLVKHFESPTVAIRATAATTASCSSRPLRRSWPPMVLTSTCIPRSPPCLRSRGPRATSSAPAGICMTASHNPAAYNGYKAYGPDGCQDHERGGRRHFRGHERLRPVPRCQDHGFR